MRALAFALSSLALAACGGGQAVSSTTTSHKRPDYAPPLADDTIRVASGDAPIPEATDATETLAFVKGGAIWLMKPNGTDARRLTSRAPDAPDDAPALSPKGDAVAYSANRDGVAKIYLAATDGSGSKAITDGADGGDAHPAWSPDGAQIAFVRGRSGERRDLYVVAAAGGAPTRLVEGNDGNPAQTGWPTWSPDGSTIVFSADRGEELGTTLWQVGADGSGLRRLTRAPTGLTWVRDARASFSPDGTRLAFASNRHGRSRDDADDLDIYELELATGIMTRLTQDGGVADDPSYSPDGKRIFFASTRERVAPYVELFVMPSGGGEQRRLTKDKDPENASPSAGRVP